MHRSFGRARSAIRNAPLPQDDNGGVQPGSYLAEHCEKPIFYGNFFPFRDIISIEQPELAQDTLSAFVLVSETKKLMSDAVGNPDKVSSATDEQLMVAF